MNRKDRIWQDQEVASGFLDVRTAFPYASDHAGFVRDLLATGRDVRRFLDVGCGAGFFTQAVHARWPEAQAVMVDFSEAMLDEVERGAIGPHETRQIDLMDRDWADGLGRFDAVVSGFAIHHLPDERKRAVYADLRAMLDPGGWFVHVEHVASASPLGNRLFDRHIGDALFAAARRLDPAITRAQATAKFDDRIDADANILAPVEDQCDWLRGLGFVDVDCFFKCYEVAIFGGRVPDGEVQP